VIYRRRLAFGGVALLVVVGVAVASWSIVAPGPIYSVADVRYGLVSDPARWVGHTVDVRGVVTFATTSSAPFDPFHPLPRTSATYALWQPALHGARIATVGPPLTIQPPASGWIAKTHGNALVGHIRSFVTRVAPRLATLFPALSAVPVVRITLLTTHGRNCAAAGCAVAQLDAMPDP
jgi:hypothetical protein